MKVKIYAMVKEGCLLKIIRKYRKLGLSMIYYEEDEDGQVAMEFIEKRKDQTGTLL